MNKCVILVDNSNIFIEGRKYSAKQKGQVKNNFEDKEVQDPSWRINFGKLLSCLASGREIHAAILVGSRPPKNDSVWETAQKAGFTVTVHDRNSRNEEKAVDTELVAQGTEIICCAPEPMVLIIASGDRDFIPLVNVAQRKNWEVEMWAFSSAFNSSGLMAATVDLAQSLDSFFSEIGNCDFEWPTQEARS